MNVAESPAPLDLISGKLQLYSGAQSRAESLEKTLEEEEKGKAVIGGYMCVAHVGTVIVLPISNAMLDFDSNYRIAGDYKVLLQAGSNLKAGFVNQVLAFYGDSGVESEIRMPALFFRRGFSCHVSNMAPAVDWRCAGPAWSLAQVEADRC